MTTRSLTDLLRSTKPPWVVLRSIGRGGAPALDDLHGLLLRTVDGARAATRAGLLREFALALEFPAYFEDDWDALEECLGDLEWLPARGYVLIVRDGDLVLAGLEQERRTWLDILGRVASEWAAQHERPFHTVLMVAEASRATARAWGVPAFGR